MAIFEYDKLSFAELGSMAKDQAVCFMAVSPLEVHGYHLPLGTDVIIAQGLQKRILEVLSRKHPDMDLVVLPPLFAGADPLPFPGSVTIQAPVLEGLVLSFAKSLAEQGFRFLVLTDNHGGPRHQMAIEAAVRKAWKKWGFSIVAPFNSLYRKMVECDRDLLEKTGLSPGSCGDDTDSHAGTNETSLLLAVAPELVSEAALATSDSTPPPIGGGARMVSSVARLLGAVGAKLLSRDLMHLARTLAWVGAPDKLPYMGDPRRASKEAGEAMIKAHIDEAMDLLDRAFRGEPPFSNPILWRLRFLRRLPG